VSKHECLNFLCQNQSCPRAAMSEHWDPSSLTWAGKQDSGAIAPGSVLKSLYCKNPNSVAPQVS